MKWKDFCDSGGKDYHLWFGDGNTLKDAKQVVEITKEEPHDVIECVDPDENMILLVFKDRYVVTGYDDNDYQHRLQFTRRDKK